MAAQQTLHSHADHAWAIISTHIGTQHAFPYATQTTHNPRTFQPLISHQLHTNITPCDIIDRGTEPASKCDLSSGFENAVLPGADRR